MRKIKTLILVSIIMLFANVNAQENVNKYNEAQKIEFSKAYVQKADLKEFGDSIASWVKDTNLTYPEMLERYVYLIQNRPNKEQFQFNTPDRILSIIFFFILLGILLYYTIKKLRKKG